MSTHAPELVFDLDRFLSLPRVSGLILAPDGSRLVCAVATVAPDGKTFTTANWELDPGGKLPPRRLTRSAPGEANAAFLPDGSLLFTSTRPDPEAKPDDPGHKEDGEVAALWVLPFGGGEARVVAAPPGGVEGLAVAREAGTVVHLVPYHPGARDAGEDEAREKARKDGGVTARLFQSYPVRYWDHYLGPREPRLQAAAPPPSADEGGLGEPRQLTPQPGAPWRFVEADFDVTPDGRTVVTGFRRDGGREFQVDLHAIDVDTATARLLVAGDGDHTGVACSPDSRRAAVVRWEWGTVDGGPGEVSLLVVDLESGAATRLAGDLDLQPHRPVWSRDGSAIFFTADQGGRTPVFRVDLGDGGVTRLSAAGTFSDLCVSPDGDTVFALFSMVSSPPQAVALDSRSRDQVPRVIPTPGAAPSLPDRVEEIWATAPDGTPIHSWLVLPEGASAERPAPLLVWIHGGPFASWTGWHWRWCPHLLAARGYAVLLPDPALSTGYGQGHLARAWNDWGGVPAADILAACDAALGHVAVDRTRTAAMGGSYGGYMANWLAGHTDRFSAIVTHASVWVLDQCATTMDYGPYLERQFGDMYRFRQRWQEQSPYLHIDRITTPMLVIHGERDHRVPVSEGLRLWTELRLRGVEAQFLHFPDENHWILRPPNVRVWYETVFAFLDHHVLGSPWRRPELL
jgi:dipeptidyl aminopeptidase/acylaminoacyl peptidase